jgi:WD40 repeat protein
MICILLKEGSGIKPGTVHPETGAPLGEPLAGHIDWVRWGAWGVVGGRPVLATGGGLDDGTVRLWDPGTGAALGEPLAGHAGGVPWGAWGVVGSRPVLATGDDGGTVRLWEVIEDRPVPRLPSYRSDTTAPVDELSRLGDAVAVAELVTARTARPPLAVGVFGDWARAKAISWDCCRSK